VHLARVNMYSGASNVFFVVYQGPAGTVGDVSAAFSGAAAGGGATAGGASQASAAAGGLAMTLVPLDQAGPARRLAVAGAAGIQEERGDRITVSELAFAPEPKAEAGGGGPVPAQAVDMAKYGALGGGTLVFLFFVGRHLRRREDEALMAEPQWLRQIEAPQSLSSLEAAQGGAGDRELAGVGARQTVEDTLRREPEKVAHQVRTWLSEDM